MRGTRTTFRVEEPSDEFRDLAYWKYDMEAVKRRYARAVFHAMGSVATTCYILKIDRSTLYGYLK